MVILFGSNKLSNFLRLEYTNRTVDLGLGFEAKVKFFKGRRSNVNQRCPGGDARGVRSDLPLQFCGKSSAATGVWPATDCADIPLQGVYPAALHSGKTSRFVQLLILILLGCVLNCALMMVIAQRTRSAALMAVDMHVLMQSVCPVTSGSTSVCSHALTLFAG